MMFSSRGREDGHYFLQLLNLNHPRLFGFPREREDGWKIDEWNPNKAVLNLTNERFQSSSCTFDTHVYAGFE